MHRRAERWEQMEEMGSCSEKKKPQILMRVLLAENGFLMTADRQAPWEQSSFLYSAWVLKVSTG